MPALKTWASVPELPAAAEAQRQRIARDWTRDQCSTADCIGIRAGAIAGGQGGEDRCLVCMGSGGADLALATLDAGGILDLRGCKVHESWYEELLSAREDRPAVTAIPGLLASATAFGDEVFFSADIEGDADFLGASFGAGAAFYDVNFKGEATFRHCFCANISFTKSTFTTKVDFVETTFEDRATFDEVRFREGADFSGAWFGPDASFFDARFDGPSDFSGVSFDGTDLGVIRFESPARFERVRAEGQFRMSWTSENQPTEISFANARFTSTTTLKGSGTISLEGADFLELSTISSWAGDLRIKSLDGTNCERLTLQDCNLSSCLLRGAIRLGNLDLEGESTFATTSGWQTRRRWVADEVQLVASFDRSSGVATAETEGAHGNGDLAAAGPSSSERHWLESRYKSLRKGLEDSGSYPAASDFYYGQMLQRLKLAGGVERLVLELYRAIGGFGVRAWRPFTGLLLLILFGAVIFDQWGQAGADFGSGLETSIQSAISLTRPIDDRDVLQGVGFSTALTLRILGPVMVAFGVLALRARVRR